MLPLPPGTSGLPWIASRQDGLLLIPGLERPCIAAAAAGNQASQKQLRLTIEADIRFKSGVDAEVSCSDFQGSAIKQNAQVKEVQDSPAVHRRFQLQESTKQLLREAAEAGELAALQWLRLLCRRFTSRDEGLLMIAAKNGNASMWSSLCMGPFPAPMEPGLDVAAANHRECLRLILSKMPLHDIAAPLHINNAINKEDKDQFIWLWKRGCLAAAGQEVIHRACTKGNLRTAQSLRDIVGASWDESCTALAAQNGHMQLLKWLRAEGCPLDVRVVHSLAKAGDTAMLEWARSQDPPCPWDSHTHAIAAGHGNLACMQWLHGAGLALCPGLCALAATKGEHTPMAQRAEQRD